tara:strand:+ start:1549 stop:2028 length:480 start_codon:yes stop_codon:yes gene_type:complete
MARKRPHIELGNIEKKRDRESFRTFVLDVIKDTFISEFIPTSISLSGELFTVELGPVDNSNPADGDYVDYGDIKGYRFVYEDLIVDDVKDYIDVYLYGVKQTGDRYIVKIFNSIGGEITTGNLMNGVSIKIIFNQSITRVPNDVVRTDFEIKGKIVEIE